MHSKDLVPAQLKLRFLALFLDLILILIYVGVLTCSAFIFYYFVLGSVPTLSTNTAHLIGFLTLTFPVTLYFILSEISQNHGSFGKRLTQLKLSSVNGKPLTAKQIITRNILKFLPWEFAHTLLYPLLNNADPSPFLLFGLILANIIPIVYIGFILLRRDHRGPHDLIAGTVVIMK